MSKKHVFSGPQKNTFFRKNHKSRFGPKKRQKIVLIAPLAKSRVHKSRVPRRVFLLRRNGGVGGEQSGDFFFGSNLPKFCDFRTTPPPILGVDIDPGGVFSRFSTSGLCTIQSGLESK